MDQRESKPLSPPRAPPPPAIPPPELSTLGTPELKEFNTMRDTFTPVRVHFAINHANVDEVRRLVTTGINLNYIIYGNTPLTLAMVKEHYDIAHVLIDGGADVTIPEKMAWKRHPLHLVAKDGRLDLVTKVLEHGAEGDTRDASGMTALQWAAVNGHSDVVAGLLCAGADVNTADEVGRTALFRAAEGSFRALVRTLVDAGADVDVSDVFGWTPLFQAVMCNDYDMVEELLSLNASPRHQNKIRQTALHVASQRLTPDNLLTLCRTDTNFYIRDRQVSCAASKHAVNNPGYELPVSELLLDHGADVNVADARHRTPLCVAAEDGNVDLVHVLVRAGADVLREAWVGEQAWPAKLAPCAQTCAWLRAHWEAGLQPLQDLCRLAIRAALGRNIEAKIQVLPLPSKLLDFLIL